MAENEYCMVKDRVRPLKNVCLLSYLSHVRLFNPMDCSMPGFAVHHQLPTCANSCPWVGDAIQSSHLLLPHPQSILLTQYLSTAQNWLQAKFCDRHCHWNSCFPLFIVFLLSTFSENQNLPVGFLLLLPTGLELICNSHLIWLGFPTMVYPPLFPSSPAWKSGHLSVHLLHSTFTQDIFIWNHFFLLRK